MGLRADAGIAERGIVRRTFGAYGRRRADPCAGDRAAHSRVG